MHINDRTLHAIEWIAQEGHLRIIDQTALPHSLRYREISSLAEACTAIETMQVRGAPLIGITAAFGLHFALRQAAMPMEQACERLMATRPTAVNLRWALTRAQADLRRVPVSGRAEAALQTARQLLQEDALACGAIGDHGLTVIRELYARLGRPLNILTHCNAGWLATADWGTALAPIYKAQRAGIPLHVWVDETRPRNQGAALTAWELQQAGVACTVIVDNAGGHLMQQGSVDLCLVGSDRTTASGDVCNKIGTYLKALAAHDNGIPFFAALPVSTIDFTMADGSQIPIEERAADEVRWLEGVDDEGRLTRIRVTPEGTKAGNPAFDVTPGRLVSGLITEHGVFDATPQGLADLQAALGATAA